MGCKRSCLFLIMDAFLSLKGWNQSTMATGDVTFDFLLHENTPSSVDVKRRCSSR